MRGRQACSLLSPASVGLGVHTEVRQCAQAVPRSRSRATLSRDKRPDSPRAHRSVSLLRVPDTKHYCFRCHDRDENPRTEIPGQRAYVYFSSWHLLVTATQLFPKRIVLLEENPCFRPLPGTKSHLLFFGYTACGRFQARDRTSASAVTQATAGTMPDP